jgi:hypothetical protein
VLCAAVAGTHVLDQPLADFFDEPQRERWYAGFVSTIGGLVWWSGAIVCLVTARVVRDRDRNIFGFWLASGALTGLLALDDLFLLHESPIRRRLHSPEWFTFLLYGLAAAAIAVIYRRRLRTMPWGLLLFGIGLGVLSVAIDQAYPHNEVEWRLLVEDGSKLFAITSWTLFFVLASSPYLTGDEAADPG